MSGVTLRITTQDDGVLIALVNAKGVEQEEMFLAPRLAGELSVLLDSYRRQAVAS